MSLLAGPVPHEPNRYCGAKTRSGTACRQQAGSRTHHSGVGRCWLHGGRTPIKHGIRSKLRRYGLLDSTLGDIAQELEDDPYPLDTAAEIAQARALYVRAAGNGGSDRDLAKLLDLITRLVKRREDALAHHAISRAELIRVMTEMGRVVATLAPEEIHEEIKTRWLRIRL